MKEKITIQMHHGEQEIQHLKDEIKKLWKKAGNKVKDIKSIEFYIKAHENKCYYVVNNDFDGSLDLV